MDTFDIFSSLPTTKYDSKIYPFELSYNIFGITIEETEKQISELYSWLYKNIGENDKWGVSRQNIFQSYNEVCIYFIFLHREDAMAFKLCWC